MASRGRAGASSPRRLGPAAGLAVLLAALVGLLAGGPLAPHGRAAERPEAAERKPAAELPGGPKQPGKDRRPPRRSRPPNFVLIQTDDMPLGQLRATFRNGGRRLAMPNTLNQIAARGVELRRYYANDPICGPSRASLLTGRTTENHGMLINAEPFGYAAFAGSRYYRRNLANWLERAGYRTIHVGKFMNGYGAFDPAEVPPGWSRWLTWVQNVGAPYYGYSINLQGAVTPPIGSWRSRDPARCLVRVPIEPGTCTHSTDVQTALAVSEINEAASGRKPFYLQVDYNAPHDDGRLGYGPEPPGRLRWIANRVERRIAAFDEPRIGDKPWFIRRQDRLTPEMKREIAERYGKEVASLRGVDEGVGRILGALRRTGQLDRTYVIFTSDNGMFHGEHRIAYGKYLPHEPSTHVPLLVRGPGIRPGTRSDALATNLDLAPTLLELAGTKAGVQLDGKSLVPFLRDPRLRSAVPAPLEGFNGHPELPEQFHDGQGGTGANQALVLNYDGFVAGRWKYVKYAYGDEELYDLHRDPGEERNLARKPRMKKVLRWARGVGSRLDGCAGAACVRPVDIPGPPGA